MPQGRPKPHNSKVCVVCKVRKFRHEFPKGKKERTCFECKML